MSNINFVIGRDVANQAVVKLGAGQAVCAVTSARADVLVDLLGWFGPGATKRFVPASPERLLDTRLGTGAPLKLVAKGETLRLPVSPAVAPAGTAAVSLNVTAADSAGAGFVVVHPCASPPPDTSNLNFRSGEAVANLSTVPLASDGAVCITTSVTTNLIADLNGWYVWLRRRRPGSTARAPGPARWWRRLCLPRWRARRLGQRPRGARAPWPSNAAAAWKAMRPCSTLRTTVRLSPTRWSITLVLRPPTWALEGEHAKTDAHEGIITR